MTGSVGSPPPAPGPLDQVLDETFAQAERHHVAGQAREAEILYDAILRVRPRHPGANHNLGVLEWLSGRTDQGLLHLEAAAAADPASDRHWRSLEEALSALFARGRLAQAEASARRLTERYPSRGFAWKLLGLICRQREDMKGAEAFMRRACETTPPDAEAHANLGALLREEGRIAAAEASYRRALAIDPRHAESHNNLGNALNDQGRLDEALEHFRDALALKPAYAEALGNLLFTLNYHPDQSAEEIFAAYREYDGRFGQPLRAEWRAHGNPRDVGRRLKVGYVSPDFRRHSARHFLEPLLAHHDRTRFEVHAYAELTREDAVTARYRGHVDHWIPTVGLSDADLADRIRADGIDILVDLAGHTARNRLGAFARKPAPVSVSWLGYGYSTGLTAIDYLLTDDIMAPAGSEPLFSETPWRLANPAFAYRPAEGMGPVSSLPAAQRGHVTFGSLTRAVRINHRTIRVWSEILGRVAGARLVIDSADFRDDTLRQALADRFAACGIAPERLSIGYHSPPWDVLRGMDIGLDCFPHNSGTTLFESLYMGVPYVTLAGRPSVGRIGSSLLEAFGHPEWIARSEEAYIDAAVSLAGNSVRLAELRSGLRAEMEASPVMDEAGFARKVEAAYREMFARWAAVNA